MRPATATRGGAGVLAALLALTACGAPAETASVRPAGDGPVTISVPGDAPTIQQAVDAARSGDLVLVSPGTYLESVAITTPGITLRGAERGGVVVDGEGRRPNGVVVTASEVAVENLTVRDHTLNGVLVTGLRDETGGLGRGSDGYTRLDPEAFPPLQGFAVRSVTAERNGLYGIYAFDSQQGEIVDSYATGSSDSGIYVGQCDPCSILVAGNTAEDNAVGYEAANASVDVQVVGNRFSNNRVGITSSSNYQEAFVPQHDAAIVGNVVADNAEADTPEQADGGFGIGIGIGGARANLVARNLVTGNPTAGVVVSSVEDLPPLDNRVVGNTFAGNAVDVAYTASTRAPGTGNCIQPDGPAPSTLPADLLTTATCPGAGAPTPGAQLTGAAPPPGIPFTEVGDAPAQPELPGGASAPWGPAVGLPVLLDLDAVPVPPADLLAGTARVR